MAKKTSNIIALAGKKRSGKSTASRHVMALLEKDGLKAIRLGFADPIKSEVAKIFGTYKEADKATLRPVYQSVAESMKIMHGRDVWLKQLSEAWNHYQNHGYNALVIDDMRFAYEQVWVSGLGGQVWKIVRETGLKDDHISETQIGAIKADHLIVNNGSETDFLVEVTNTYYSK